MAQLSDIPGSLCVPEVGLLAALKWNRNSKGQGQIKQKIKDLPALFKNGLNLKKKHADVIYSETICCAGRALRDNFVSLAPHLLKDRIADTGKFKRSSVGFEMVDWLLHQCPFISTRTKAEGIWQTLLELGIISSATKSQESFEDKDIFYQFSNDECDVLVCPFGKDEEWKNGVRLLGHLVPYIQSRTNLQIISEQTSAEEKIVSSDEVLEIQVKKELVAAIASKTETSPCKEENRSHIKQVDLKDSAENVKNNKDGIVCSLREGGDFDGNKLIQKQSTVAPVILTEDIQPVTEENFSRIRKSDEVSTVGVKEQGHDVLILKKVSSSSPAPAAGSALNDLR
ncbi:rap guanine nucleotide exchange factor 5-like [Rhinoraja longicauda]